MALLDLAERPNGASKTVSFVCTYFESCLTRLIPESTRDADGATGMHLRTFLRGIGAACALQLVILSQVAQAQEQTTQQLPLPVGQATTESFDKRWTIKFDSEIKYSTTDIIGRLAPNGTLHSNVMNLPFGISIVGQPNELWKIELGARGGYIDSRQRDDAITGRFSGFTDTTVSATTTYYGFNGFQPFISLNGNLPTGTTRVSVTQNNAVPDPDVTGTKGFGEGTNFGPTIGVNIPINQNTIIALGIGHTTRGSFTRPGDGPAPGVGPTMLINPGDVTTATAQIGYQEGAFSFMSQIGYSWESTTTADSVNFFKSGDKIQVAAAIGYAWTEMWSSRLTVSYMHLAKNNNLLPPYLLEAFNSNNDVSNVSFDTTYKNGSWAVGPSVGYMYRARNSWSPLANQFVPAKFLWTLGGVAQYQVTNQSMINARVSYITGKTGNILNAGNATPELLTRGWQMSVGGAIQF